MQDFNRYIPHTDEDCRAMLETLGLRSVEDLFDPVPHQFRLQGPLRLPEPLSEPDLLRFFRTFRPPKMSSFLGAGAYHHVIPSVIPALLSRSEFYTAYTPYQPEISQGTLQAIFEYQTLICQLTGMEVSNASMYDGASSLAEAVLMAERISRRKRVLLSEAIHPEYRRVIHTYLDPDLHEIASIPCDRRTGQTDGQAFMNLLDRDTSAVVLQSPNFFGVVEDLQMFSDRVHEAGGLMVSGFSEAIAYGLLRPPGAMGADIVAGEGQSLGIPVSYGGPYLGVFATLEQHVRAMPGRLVGETVDLDGRRGFVLTLATREQHIRRERATSNICTNEGLCALMATVFLSCFGREGLREMALMNLSKGEHAKKRVSAVPRCRVAFSAPTFNEFVVEIEGDPEKTMAAMRQEQILGGLALDRFYPHLRRHLLVTVTEMVTREEIDRWAEVLEESLK